MKKTIIIISALFAAAAAIAVYISVAVYVSIFGSEPVTAEIFDSTLYGHQDMAQMSAIQHVSFEIIGTDADKFDDIAGWEEKISSDEKMLCKQYEMFGYSTTVMLVLEETRTYIDHVLYDFAEVTTKDTIHFRYIIGEVTRDSSQTFLMKNGNLHEVDFHEFSRSYEIAVRNQSEIAYSQVWQYTWASNYCTTSFSHTRINQDQDQDQDMKNSLFETTLLFTKTPVGNSA